MGQERGKIRRGYRPSIEPLEGVNLLSGLATIAPGLPAPAEVAGQGLGPVASAGTWDEAIVAAQLDGLIGASGATTLADRAEVEAGLAQCDRYLARAWFRAGIAPQQHDDCTQAVYASLLGSLGRDRFDQLLGDVGRSGIRDVLSRETPEGPDFFRAIDTIKKRAQRERSFQALDSVDLAASSRGSGTPDERNAALHEAILRNLSPREAALIRATLQGETPAEIAQQWGIAPKTVSNEKTRAFQKLRDVLGPDLLN